MMKIGLFALVASIGANASDPAAWDIAPRWICRAETMHTCEAASCTTEPGLAVLQIDFAKGTVRSGGSDKKFDEHIIAKKRFDILDSSDVDLDSGSSVVLQITPAKDVTGAPTRSRKFVTTRTIYPSSTSYFGECFPAD